MGKSKAHGGARQREEKGLEMKNSG